MSKSLLLIISMICDVDSLRLTFSRLGLVNDTYHHSSAGGVGAALALTGAVGLCAAACGPGWVFAAGGTAVFAAGATPPLATTAVAPSMKPRVVLASPSDSMSLIASAQLLYRYSGCLAVILSTIMSSFSGTS